MLGNLLKLGGREEKKQIAREGQLTDAIPVECFNKED